MVAAATSAAVAAQIVGEIETIAPPEQGFYSKRIVVRGIPVMSHADVNDAALEEAARRLDRLLARAPEITANLRLFGVQMHVIGKDQQVSDLPEYRHMKGKPFEGKATMDERGRGYGGLHASCAEESLLLLPSDRFSDHRDICSHEFAHAILAFGLSRDIRDKWQAQWRTSLDAGRWKTMYAATNADEFFAELTMWYLGSRGDYGKLKPPPRPGALWLRSYDPEAYALLDAIYTGQLKPQVVETRDLPALPADSEGKVLSKGDQPATQVIFVNTTDKPVKMFWLDFEGKRKSYGVVLPGGVASQSTYVTHAWLLETDDGRCLGIYVPEEKIGRVVIGGATRAAPAAQAEPPPADKKAPPEFDPTSAYRPHSLQGFTNVLVNEKLLAEAELSKAVLAELDHQLYQVTRKVPPKALAELQKVKIWVELTDKNEKCMCYHPSVEWLRGHGYNPEKAKSVELGHAKNFVAWTQHQPYMVLHELAHAYHHQVLGYDYPPIKAAFKKAVESKSYESVVNYEGKHVRHYALSNDQEYFAECTEAFFGTNDFYPFVRGELMVHDPDIFKVLVEAWNKLGKETLKPGGEK
ncbi:MAG: hypothetical protein NTW87_15440 [Planctomycetota bacterium]|nr:hypothetical protein [Planctomycetota bacterium]